MTGFAVNVLAKVKEDDRPARPDFGQTLISYDLELHDGLLSRAM